MQCLPPTTTAYYGYTYYFSPRYFIFEILTNHSLAKESVISDKHTNLKCMMKAGVSKIKFHMSSSHSRKALSLYFNIHQKSKLILCFEIPTWRRFIFFHMKNRSWAAAQCVRVFHMARQGGGGSSSYKWEETRGGWGKMKLGISWEWDAVAASIYFTFN